MTEVSKNLGELSISVLEPLHKELGNLVHMGVCRQVGGTDRTLGHCTCDLVLPKLIVFVRLLQGLDG